MKNILIPVLMMSSWMCYGQSIQGTWQLTEEKACIQAIGQQSDTERELESAMKGSSQSGVARLIVFDSKGNGQEGIFAQGKKKGSDKSSFQYKMNDQELLLLDKKSGIITQRLIIEELTATTLRFHDALKDCEIKSFTRVK